MLKTAEQNKKDFAIMWEARRAAEKHLCNIQQKFEKEQKYYLFYSYRNETSNVDNIIKGVLTELGYKYTFEISYDTYRDKISEFQINIP